MPRKGGNQVSMSIRREIYDHFFGEYRKGLERQAAKGVKPSFAAYMTERLYELKSRDDYLARYLPMLDVLTFVDYEILIRDNRLDRIVEVFVKDGLLHCRLDQEDDCVHVGFCYALPEVCEAMIKHGFRPTPRKSR